MLKSVQTVAIIDSGIGGLSILNQLIDKFKSGNYIYFADNLNMPYGNKTESFLKKRMLYLIDMLKTKYNVDLIIIACNTASSVINKLNLENVITMQFKKELNYLGTPLTKKMLPNHNIIADKTLAKQIENNFFSNTLTKKIKEHIKKYNLNNLKQLTLGCTHYELVADKFKEFCPDTEINCNTSYIINDINIKADELNVVLMLSKQSKCYENKILKIIRR